MALGIALAFPVLQLHMLDLFPAGRGAAASMPSYTKSLLMNAAVTGLVAPPVSSDARTIALTSGGFGPAAAVLWPWHLTDSRIGVACD